LRDWEQSDFASRAGVSRQRVSTWVAGSVPRTENLPTIARTLGVSAETIFRVIEGAPMAESAFHPTRSFADALADASLLAPVAVPLIRAADARLSATAPPTEYVYLPPAYRANPPKRYFALRAPDDAMAPAILTGDTLVIDPDLRPVIDAIAVVAGASGITVGRLVAVGKRRYYRQDATGDTVTTRRAGDLLGVVVMTIRTH
jgi:transcriptional regulator with XRE-family HTH domain